MSSIPSLCFGDDIQLDEATSKKRGSNQRPATYVVCELTETVRRLCSGRGTLSRLRYQVKADPETNSTRGNFVSKLCLSCFMEQDFAGSIVSDYTQRVSNRTDPLSEPRRGGYRQAQVRVTRTTAVGQYKLLRCWSTPACK